MGRLRVLLIAVLVTALAGAGAVVSAALHRPGADSAAAKLAEWARDHGLGDEVTWLERLQYRVDQPPVGGTPSGGIPTPMGTVQAATSAVLPSGPLLPLAGGAPLPGEGEWRTVVAVKGRPAVQVAALRPDDSHTSFVAGVLRMDPAMVRGELRPGTIDPGGSWRAPTSLTRPEWGTVVAAFNAGFRLNDHSYGGYYGEGRTVAPLIDGDASLVVHTDGTVDVGSWNREVRMGPTVASVRQNLVPLVDDGQVNPSCATGGAREWGKTVGQQAYIHRSGFGITGTGAEVYVAGPALSVCTLGHLLTDAGVVRGMELDINPDWVSGAYFQEHPDGSLSGYKLFPAEKVDARHYLQPSSRDWFAWFMR